MRPTPEVQIETSSSSRARALGVVAAVAVMLAALVYVAAVRTQVGQRLDGVAFVRRSAVTADTTRATDHLLGTISAASCIGLGSVFVLVALARRRAKLAVAVVVAMGGAVLSGELLKSLLTRPDRGNFGGVLYNTFPSGHATVGMALALGLVLVAPRHLGRAAAVIAALVSTAYGTAVLSSGWHRPSDTIGAYLLTLAWFSATAAVVSVHDQRHPSHAARRDAPASRPLLAAAATGVFGLLMFVLLASIRTNGLRTVVYAAPYVAACVAIDATGVVVVGCFYVVQRASIRFEPPVPARRAAPVG